MRKILVIPHRAIGDVIFQIPLIKALDKNSELVIIANKTNKADLLLENFQNTQVYFFDFSDKKFKSKIKNIFLLKNFINSFKADEIYCLGSSTLLLLSIILSKPTKKLLFGIIGSKLQRNKHNKTRPSEITLNFLKKYQLGAENFILDLNQKKHTEILNKYKNYEEPWVFFSIDSFHNAPNWEIDNYKKLIEISTNYFETVFVNTMHRHEYIFDNLNLGHEIKKKIVKTSSLDWRDIMSLIKNTKLFVGNHSGPGHFADSINTRAIIINNNKHKNALWSEKSNFIGTKSTYINTWDMNNDEIINYITNEFKKK